jgi:hypothetical protein
MSPDAIPQRQTTTYVRLACCPGLSHYHSKRKLQRGQTALSQCRVTERVELRVTEVKEGTATWLKQWLQWGVTFSQVVWLIGC